MKSKEIHNILSNKERKTLRQQFYLNCSVDKELFHEFKEYISANNIGQSELIRTLVKNYLAEVQDENNNIWNPQYLIWQKIK